MIIPMQHFLYQKRAHREVTIYQVYTVNSIESMELQSHDHIFPLFIKIKGTILPGRRGGRGWGDIPFLPSKYVTI